MIKANELRIGNHTSEGVIKCFYESGVHVGMGRCFKFEELEPIPLTEEWLLKFGFGKVVFDSDETGYGVEYHLKHNGNNGFIIEYMDDFSCCILGHKDDVGVAPNLDNCKHVHQLQNLYFALTNEELKIEL